MGRAVELGVEPAGDGKRRITNRLGFETTGGIMMQQAVAGGPFWAVSLRRQTGGRSG